jgi:hypothetical protein
LVSAEIVYRIKNCGTFSGRFLKRDEKRGIWVEVSENVARYKVAHAIRDNLRQKQGEKLEEEQSNRKSPPTTTLPRPPDSEEVDPLDHPNLDAAVVSRPIPHIQEKLRTASAAVTKGSFLTSTTHARLSGTLPVEGGGDTKSPAKRKTANISGTSNLKQAPPGSSSDEDSEEESQEEQVQEGPYDSVIRSYLAGLQSGPTQFSQNVTGQVFNLDQVPPELLQGPNVFVTYVEASDESVSVSDSEDEDEEDSDGNE